MKKILLILGILILLCCAISYAFMGFLDFREQQRWEAFLSYELPSDIVNDLCQRDLVPPHVVECSDPNRVIEYHHIPDILHHNLGADATHEDVKGLFGQYERDCETDEANTYHCGYYFASYRVILFYDGTSRTITHVLWPSRGS